MVEVILPAAVAVQTVVPRVGSTGEDLCASEHPLCRREQFIPAVTPWEESRAFDASCPEADIRVRHEAVAVCIVVIVALAVLVETVVPGLFRIRSDVAALESGTLRTLDLVPAVTLGGRNTISVAIFEAPLAAARNQEWDRKQNASRVEHRCISPGTTHRVASDSGGQQVTRLTTWEVALHPAYPVH